MDSSTMLYNQLKSSEPFFLLAGPNVIESEEHIMYMAKAIKSLTSKFGLKLVFKSSFDKANRTSSKSFRGPGMIEGLKILEKVKVAYDIPIVTDVHEIEQTDLLVAAAKTGKIINIKKGQFCAPSVMVNSAEKIRLAGNENVMVCERGTMFGYNDLIVDPRNLEWMREANCPIEPSIVEPFRLLMGPKPRGVDCACHNQHQLEGGGVASGGLRELIPCIARTAVAVGVDGIFMEVQNQNLLRVDNLFAIFSQVYGTCCSIGFILLLKYLRVHNDPLNAPVDGPTQWPLRHLEELLEELVAIAAYRLMNETLMDMTYVAPPLFIAIFITFEGPKRIRGDIFVGSFWSLKGQARGKGRAYTVLSEERRGIFSKLQRDILAFLKSKFEEKEAFRDFQALRLEIWGDWLMENDDDMKRWLAAPESESENV
uniref:3-deoxy-8-phosphooctulonate synthase n=1 Tax=Vitis vinifera TaxID=29760 RepID=A5BVI1_VITVI|nr:hypothetical protein VITISV_018855 [Vitis vinifera]